LHTEEAKALADAGKSAEAYVVADMGLRWAMNYFACATKALSEALALTATVYGKLDGDEAEITHREGDQKLLDAIDGDFRVLETIKRWMVNEGATTIWLKWRPEKNICGLYDNPSMQNMPGEGMWLLEEIEIGG
jgi:hypothetical protein